MSFAPVSQWIKDHWYTITIMIMIAGVMSSGVTYYAKAETEKLIKQEIAEPMSKIDEKLEQIQKNQEGFDDIITQQKIDVEKNKEKLNSIENRLDLIIRLLDRDRSPRPDRNP